MFKLAEELIPPGAVDPILAEVGRGAQTELRRQSMEQAAKAGLGAFALGALLRTVYGLAGSGRPPIAPSKDKGVLRDSPYNPSEYSFPLPVKRREQQKQAELPANPFQGPSVPEGQWWHYPVVTAAGLAGAYGGYHVADRIAAAKRHEEMKARLEAARKEFDDATVGLFNQPLVERAMPGQAKAASESPLAGLHALYKSGNWEDFKGKALGTYLAVALPMAATVGYLNYQESKKRQRATLLKQVLDSRAKERTLSSPPEFRAEPVPALPDEAL